MAQIDYKQIKNVAEKSAVRIIATSAIPTYTLSGSGVGSTLTASATGILTIDGVNILVGDRILLTAETSGNAKNNLIWVCTTAGTVSVPYVLTLAQDNDTSTKLTFGMTVNSGSEGTSNSGTSYYMSVSSQTSITIGITAISWSILKASASNNLPSQNNQNMTASTTVGNGQQACVTALSATPAGGGAIRVMVNGVQVNLQYSSSAGDCYFANSGTLGTPLSQAGTISGSVLVWQGNNAGYSLSSTDVISFDYNI